MRVTQVTEEMFANAEIGELIYYARHHEDRNEPNMQDLEKRYPSIKQ